MTSAVPRVAMKNIYRASLVAVAQAVSEVSYPSAASAAPPWGGLGVWMELSAMYFFYACYHHLSPTSFWSRHRSKTNKPPTCPESLWHMTRHHYLRWFAIGIQPNDQGDELDTSLEMDRLIWAACNFLDGQLNQSTNEPTNLWIPLVERLRWPSQKPWQTGPPIPLPQAALLRIVGNPYPLR